MNKAILSIILSAIFIVFSNNQAEAQSCAQNFTSMAINMNVGGCTYDVDICVKCSPLSGATEVDIVGGARLVPTIPACQPSIPYAAAVDYIISQIKTPSFILNELCTNSPDAPPCNSPQDPIEIKVTSYLCWKAEVVEYFGVNTLYFNTCSTDKCEQVYEVCVDSNGEYQETLISQTGDTPTCTIEATEFSFPRPDVDPVGTTTPCYIYHSACNP